jgi:hypothetical protein
MARRKTPRQRLVKKLDDKIRVLVKKRDKNRCVYCNKYITGVSAHISHVKGRRLKSLRWDMNNVKLLCQRHHIYWWHREPMEAWQWFQEKYPIRADYILRNKNKVVKYSVTDLEDKLEELNNV